MYNEVGGNKQCEVNKMFNLQRIRENEQYEMREVMYPNGDDKKSNKAFLLALAVVIVACIALWVIPAQADHNDVEFLKDKQLVGQGQCTIRSDIPKFTVPCEMYMDREGNRYIALYMDGKVQVVKRQNPDGTQENVYIRVRGQAI